MNKTKKANNLSKFEKIIKKDYRKMAIIRIIDEKVEFELNANETNGRLRETIIRLLHEAEKAIYEYNIENVSDEIKKAFIAIYTLYNVGTSDSVLFITPSEDGISNRNRISMEKFLKRLGKITCDKEHIVKELWVGKDGRIDIFVRDEILTININVNRYKDRIRAIFDFFLNPKKYIKKFELKKVFIPMEHVATLDERKDGTIFLLAKRTIVDV